MDGLVYPDRRPHTDFLEYRNVYRPVKNCLYNQDTGTLTLAKLSDFTDLQEEVEIHYEVSCDGRIPADRNTSSLHCKAGTDGGCTF